MPTQTKRPLTGSYIFILSTPDPSAGLIRTAMATLLLTGVASQVLGHRPLTVGRMFLKSNMQKAPWAL